MNINKPEKYTMRKINQPKEYTRHIGYKNKAYQCMVFDIFFTGDINKITARILLNFDRSKVHEMRILNSKSTADSSRNSLIDRKCIIRPTRRHMKHTKDR